MAHITIEYVILLPLLILQIILFPMTANWLMDIWVDSRRELVLEEIASHLGSTIQQVYFTLNHDTVPTNTNVTHNPNLPPYIEDYPYVGQATLKTDPASNSCKLLELTLTLKGAGTTVATTVLLGPNAEWREESIFVSNSNSTGSWIKASKKDGIITLQFGG